MKMKRSRRSEDCPPGNYLAEGGEKFSFPLPEGTSALRGASDELHTAPPCSPGGLKLRHPMQHRANILFRYAPTRALPPLSMLVADSFAELL